MFRLRYLAASRTASIVVASLATFSFSFSFSFSADAQTTSEPRATATMSCDRVAELGRVKCSIEARTTGGRTIAWADVALVELPELAAALKGRIGPADAVAKEPGLQRWAFGLVAKKTGEGEAKARVRLVVCEPADAGASRCAPVSVDVRALIHVG
jgi:hypothetical protein